MRRMYSKPQLLEAVEQESKINGIKVFENIVDKDGHKRFIEGSITSANLPEGISINFAKWSLSGTHLMIVLSLSGENGKTLSGYTNIGKLNNLPSWIYDNIAILFSTNVVVQDSKYWFGGDGTSQVMTYRLYKQNNEIFFMNTGNLTLSADRQIRISVDLLID